jgi:uncharacterized protein YjiS (DUF1127 family)
MTTAMATDYVASAKPRLPLGSRVSAALAALFGGLRKAHQLRRDLAYLQECDDRMLADIGLSRSQIEGAVRFGRYY